MGSTAPEREPPTSPVEDGLAGLPTVPLRESFGVGGSEDPVTVDPPSFEEAAKDPIVVRGYLVEAGARAPVIGATLRFAQGTLGGSGGATEEAVTGEDGSFTLRLDPEAWSLGALCNVRATLSTGETLFRAPCQLEPEMTIVAARELVLAGRLVPERRAGGVRIYEPVAGGTFFVGDTHLREGGFTCRVRSADPPPAFLLVFAFDDGIVVSRTVPTRELCSPQGAVVAIDLLDFRVRVEDEGGRPVEGAEVRLAELGGAYRSGGRTDDGGRFVTPAVPTLLEYCVGKQDRASAAGTVDPVAGELVVSLPELTADDRIAGTVLLADGEPVAEAFVSASPRTSDAETGQAAFVSAYSDAEGRFELHVASDLPLLVSAFKDPYGLSPLVRAQAGERALLLTIPERGSLRFTLEDCLSSGVNRAALVAFSVVDAVTGEGFVDTTYSLPVLVEELPVGTYDVLVHVPGLGVLAEGSLAVDAGRVDGYALPCDVARYVRGRVLDPGGEPLAGARVRALPYGWRAPAVDGWCTTTTDELGAFELLAGVEDDVRLEVYVEGELVSSRRVTTDTEVTVRVEGR